MKLTKLKLKEIIREEIQKLNEARKYKLGDMWSNDFDYEGMMKVALKTKETDKVDKLQKLHDSMTDVNYHTVASPLLDAIDQLTLNKDVPEAKKMARSYLKKFHKMVKDDMKAW